MSERLSLHGTSSPSAALTDLFDAKHLGLDQLKRLIQSVDGQLGAMVEISGRPQRATW